MTTSQHRKHRGMKTQALVAGYLRANGWPHAGSAGAGRTGSDITETPDIAVEVKARRDFNPLAWVRQARAAADGRLAFAVVRPDGIGETPGEFLVCIRLADFVPVLRCAGYGSGPVAVGGQFAPIVHEPAPCPECNAGKHGNCDGTTWDVVTDDFAACPCREAGHG